MLILFSEKENGIVVRITGFGARMKMNYRERIYLKI